MLAFTLFLLQAAAVVAEPGRVYHGGHGELDVRAIRREATVVIDGRLDEAVWDEAALLTGFSQFSPRDGVPAADSTEVLVWYSGDAIYFGVRAFEPHGAVNARLTDRDHVAGDDHVLLLLDTHNDARRALVFAVNPFGVQADGIRSEGMVQRGGFTAASEEAILDLSPDFVFQAQGRITEYGYDVEVRIPFRSIRYQAAPVQDWGLHIVRVVQHSGHQQTWAPALRDRSSFLAQAGKLRGLEGLGRGVVVDLNPVATARLDGAPSQRAWNYGSVEPELGLNARWAITPNLTLNGTVNPDFSQVEADAGQLVLDPRRATFFAEKRPFFLEGNEQFDTPNRLVYTRRIVAPVVAAKVTGKIGGTDIGLLSAVDDAVLSPTGDHPIVNLLRVRRDLGAGSHAGFVYTDRVDGSRYNRVLGGDGRLLFGRIYSVSLQGAASFTGAGTAPVAAPLWNLSFDRNGRRFGLQASIEAIDPDFEASSGFLSRTGTLRLRVTPRMTVYGRPGATLESWTGALNLYGNWLYDRFFGGGASEDLHLFANNSFAFRGGWRLNTSFILESFGYPDYLYADYFVERRDPAGIDTIPFTGTARIPNYVFVGSGNTPQWARGGADLQLIFGRDENFDEWAPAYLLVVNGGASWRPTEQLRLDARYIRQQYIRPSDRTTVSVRDLPRLKAEYQLTRDIFLRFVGQYDARMRATLRDDSRTGDPILIRDPATGVYHHAPRQASNLLRVDWLFSYRPVPGTVVFAGYGSSLTEPDALRFGQLSRTSDGFFVKLSYLFRL